MADRCPKEALLSAWLDDELDEGERARLAVHLDECAACTADLEGLRVVQTQLRSLPERHVPERVFEDVAALRQRARAGVVVVAATGMLLLATMASDGVEEQSPRTVDVPVDSFVADHVTHTSDGALFVPVEHERER